MKRYRGKNANYGRCAEAFVPAKKWGKRNKRQYERNVGWTKDLFARAGMGPQSHATAGDSLNYNEIMTTLAMLPEIEPIVTTTSSTVALEMLYGPVIVRTKAKLKVRGV